eukprot:6465047-Amphidinium_carterae.1
MLKLGKVSSAAREYCQGKPAEALADVPGHGFALHCAMKFKTCEADPLHYCASRTLCNFA